MKYLQIVVCFCTGLMSSPVHHTYCGHHSYNQTGHHHNSQDAKNTARRSLWHRLFCRRRERKSIMSCAWFIPPPPLNNQRFWITNIRVCRLPQHQLTTDNQNIMCLHSFIHSCMLSHCEENAVWDQELFSI